MHCTSTSLPPDTKRWMLVAVLHHYCDSLGGFPLTILMFPNEVGGGEAINLLMGIPMSHDISPNSQDTGFTCHMCPSFINSVYQPPFGQ